MPHANPHDVFPTEQRIADFGAFQTVLSDIVGVAGELLTMADVESFEAEITIRYDITTEPHEHLGRSVERQAAAELAVGLLDDVLRCLDHGADSDAFRRSVHQLVRVFAEKNPERVAALRDELDCLQR